MNCLQINGNKMVILWQIIIYSILGWCLEVGFAWLTTKQLVNRGFLNGPYCPIYGIGAVLMINLLTPITNFIERFIVSIIVLSILEFITGYLLERLFNEKWWDYSDRKFNLGGYICLEFAVLWGAGMMVVMLVIHPLVETLINTLPVVFNWSSLIFVLVIVMLDLLLTIRTLVDLNQWIVLYHKVADKVAGLSDSIKITLLASTEKMDSHWESMERKLDRLNHFIKEDYLKLKDLSSRWFSEHAQSLKELETYQQRLNKLSKLVNNRLFAAYPRLSTLLHKLEFKRLSTIDLSKIINKHSDE
jgi:uncharacterized membrane protein